MRLRFAGGVLAAGDHAYNFEGEEVAEDEQHNGPVEEVVADHVGDVAAHFDSTREDLEGGRVGEGGERPCRDEVLAKVDEKRDGEEAVEEVAAWC